MRVRRPSPTAPHHDDEYQLPYLAHGNTGWNDETEARKRQRKIVRPFTFGFGDHAESDPEALAAKISTKRVSVKDGRNDR